VHGGQEGTGNGKLTNQVGGEEALELGYGGLFEGNAVKHAGAVDHHVGRADLRQNVVSHACDGGSIADITGQVVESVMHAALEAPRHSYDARAGTAQGGCNRRPNATRRAGHQSYLAGERAHSTVRLCASRRNSSRVLESSRKMPRTALVTAREFCFSTPRIIMQK